MLEPKSSERTRVFLPTVAVLLLCSCFQGGDECDQYFALVLGMKTRVVESEEIKAY